MAPEEFKRKLTAILSADVEGYSRLMGEDEDATIRTLTNYRELMSTLIHKHRGRVVDSPGDNLLAEFGSVVDAVRCAVEIQEELRVRNAELPENRKMVFRIGVNLGDVVQEGERIYGDGVNIAARVEGLAEGGGICISGTVYDSIKNKLSLSYESIGEHTVKNIKEPVRIYRMRVGPEATARKEARPKRWRWPALAAVIALILVVGAVAIWNLYLRGPSVEPASVDKMAYPLPDKPSIAVLPFTNMSDDPKQEYFCDGMTEEIITGLSKQPDLFVIARNSSFTYKGKPVKVQKVSEDLGVRYVLEGSVKKAGDRIRITAQLIDAIAGNHLWAERYDRELKDIFAVQDEITIKILEAMGLKITIGLKSNILSKGAKNLDAYLKVLEGYHYIMLFNLDDNIRAKKLFKDAIVLDPEYPAPYAFLGICHMMDVMQGTTKKPKESLMQAYKMAQKALNIDETQFTANSLLGNIHFAAGRYDKAIRVYERVLEINPNHNVCLYMLGSSLLAIGKPQEAVPLYHRALRADPLEPALPYHGLGGVNLSMERYEEAIKYFKKALESGPKNMTVLPDLAFCYSALGRDEDARAVAAEILKLNPKFSVRKVVEREPLPQDIKEKMRAALLKIGLPE